MTSAGHDAPGRAGHQVIWMRPERAARGPRPAHSRQELAAAGIRVADADGLEAVSMRRIAAEIGTGTTSLYRYILTKEELFDLMADAVMGQEEPPAVSGDWQADLRTMAYRTRAVTLRHPWLAALPPGRPALGPSSLRWLESCYQAVAQLGLSADDMLAVVGTVLTFVRGHVTSELAEEQAAQRSGLDNDQWMAAQGSYGETIINGGQYPALSRVMVEAAAPHAADRFERGFATGLDHILSGLAAAIPVG
jgi:AcrR family transcriptional regulator